MKFDELKKYMGFFIVAVLLIAVYKTFDSIGLIFSALGDFVSVFRPIIMAFAIAFLLFPLCKKVEVLYEKCKIKFIRKHRRGLSVLSVVFLLILTLGLIIWIILPKLIVNVKELIAQLPELLKSLIIYINSFGIIELDYKEIFQSFSLDKLFMEFDFNNVNKYAQSVAGASGTVIDFFISVIISIYALIDRDSLMKNAKRIVRITIKDAPRSRLAHYLKMACNFVYRYLSCQLIDGVVVFALAFIVLLILDVKYGVVFSVMLGLFNLVPYFGAFIAIASTVLVTLVSSGFTKALIVLVALVVLQQVDANIIQPRLVRHVMEVKPFWVLCAILVGSALFGMIGILLAVPFIAFSKTLINEYLDYREKKQNVSTNQS